MMDIVIDDATLTRESRGEIEHVLHRIAVEDERCEWRALPDEICVKRRLSGGRSGCEVLEVVVRREQQRSAKVVKLGPADELAREFGAWDEHLRGACSFFAPIQAATHGVLDPSRAAPGEREAIVYDHAARFKGVPQSPAETFEAVARQAIVAGGERISEATQLLQKLFEGIKNDLYEKFTVTDAPASIPSAWNRRLGTHAVIVVDRFDAGHARLAMGPVAESDLDGSRIYPSDLVRAASGIESDIKPDMLIHLRRLKAAWRGDRLMGEDDSSELRVEIVAAEDRDIGSIAGEVTEGSEFAVCGRLASLRTLLHCERLLGGLPELSIKKRVLRGPGAEVPDPFAFLPKLLESRRHRIASLVHGDLNPRNILVVDDSSCLIDYAFTRPGDAILSDFARLEGSLARHTLPGDLTWSQHVRLQRLLAVASRLGDDAAERFAERLSGDRPELASAFRLLWAVRRAARESYPAEHFEQWSRDYLEQLFLFAHLSLKWEDDQTDAALRATAAMVGVATEAVSGEDVYRWWSLEGLRGDGVEILGLLKQQPAPALSDLVGLARSLDRRALKPDDPLETEYESLRSEFVRQGSRTEAHTTLNRLREDHEVYITLQAYIDLKGQVTAGRKRERRSFKEMAQSDESMAERERLQAKKHGEDALILLAQHPALTVIGDAGGGKSTVAREWEYRLANSILGHRDQSPRLPITVRAPDVASRLGAWEADDPKTAAAVLEQDPDLLAAGALHVTVDALNELAEKEKQQVAEWIIALRQAYPRTSVLACHRQYNYVPGLLPFPVVTLQKVEAEQARDYVGRYLHEKQVSNHEELAGRLVELLLEDPEHQGVRDLAQTPLFLWMIVERYRQTEEIPENRGRLFDDFARWYLEERHHAEHGEPVERRYPYEDKAILLGALGYELVQRSATDLSEGAVGPLVPQEIADGWQDVLEEIVESEMLMRTDGRLRFLHQSFQEYFAARHFLDHEARDSKAIRDKVWRFGWHDTFAVLMGFAGDAPEVVGQVVEAALEVNPTLTARCLRMAEVPDERLLELFVQQQEATLCGDLAGGFAHGRAAQALFEHGRGPTREALLRVAGDATAPGESRVECLGRLASMPGQARFEPVAGKIRDELSALLVEILEQDAATDVHQAAIDAVVTAKLSDLSAYLSDLVQRGEWPLCRSAWEACAKLGLRLTRGQRKAYVNACQARLEGAEKELFQEAVVQRMRDLNHERVAILEQLAAPEHLPLLLRRRFSLGIRDKVAGIVDKAAAAEGQPPDDTAEALAILREEAEDKTVVTDEWLRLAREGDDLVAAAAGHRAAALGEEVPGDTLRRLFDPALPPDRLAIVAGLASASEDESLAAPLEQLIRALIETIEGPAATEALSCLAQALMALDAARGRQLVAVASMIFDTRRDEAVQAGRFPWRFVSSVFLKKGDYEALLARGGDDAKGAIFYLCAYGGGLLGVANRPPLPTELGDDTLQALRYLATNEGGPAWQHHHARAAAWLNAVNLLPWLLQVSPSPKLREGTETIYHETFGARSERYVADVLRAIGYLARRLRDDDRAEEATAAAAALEKEYAAISGDTDRSIVVGVTTALGYLGQWEPILTHLGPGEPWMHEAAQNVFNYWVAKPPEGIPERERAARWIARRLAHDPDLAPEVRSTLEAIKEDLERDVGHHVGTG